MPEQREHCAGRALQASGTETEMTLRHILAVTFVMSATSAQADSSWDGTWAGTLNNEPVSVTIASGRVVGYTIRGFSPLPIEFARVTSRSVSMLIGPAYRVRITKEGYRSALGVAHGPLGEGVTWLTRQ
jgi:hypothetical protein